MKYKVGDTVYPCYDGKLSRATACKVVDINPQGALLVEGCFWAENTILTTAWFTLEENDYGGSDYCAWVSYGSESPTTMQLITSAFVGDEVPGDYYSLKDLTKFKDVLNSEYANSLGIELQL